MNYKILKQNRIHKDGFTIIELLIAMASFSFILLLTTVVLMNISSLYGKGVNQTKIDDATRYIADDISSKLKFSESSSFQVAPDRDSDVETGAYCAGGYKYSFSSKNSDSNPDLNFLRKIALPTGTACEFSASDHNKGSSLLPGNTNLTYFGTNFYPNGTTSYFKIKVSLLYGQFSNANLSDFNTTCKTGSGYTYCAVSKLENVVSARLN